MDKTTTRLFLLLSLLGVACCARSSKTIYGCRYRPSLCLEYQECVEDNLFGTCKSVLGGGRVQRFQTSESLREILEFSLQGLLDLGYGWSDTYTQCIIGGLLENYQPNLTPELEYCDKQERERLRLVQQTQESQGYLVPHTEPPTAKPEETTSSVTDDLLSELSDADLEFLKNYLLVSRPTIDIIDSTDPTTEQAGDDAAATLSETDQWLLEQLTSELITVDDLTSAQIRRLRAYLQRVLSNTGPTTPGSTTPTPAGQWDTRSTERATPGIDEEIQKLLRQFTAESMKNEGESKPGTAGVERLNDDIIGQQISNQLKTIQHRDMSPYVDKKSEYIVRSSMVEAPDKEPELTDPPGMHTPATTEAKRVDTSYVWVSFKQILNDSTAADLVTYIAHDLGIERSKFGNVRADGGQLSFQVLPDAAYNSTQIATKIDNIKEGISNVYGIQVLATGIGHGSDAKLQIAPARRVPTASNVTTVAVVATVLVVVLLAVLILLTWRCMYKRWSFSKNKFEKLSNQLRGESTQDSYEDLCRQRMQTTEDKKSPSSTSSADAGADLDKVSPLKSKAEIPGCQSERMRSPRSSTSSWSEEPVNLTMDISTGHTVLAYMEDHLKNTERLEGEWAALGSYVPDTCDVETGKLNPAKNRYPSVLPYDHNRVKLSHTDERNDYINASFIADLDRRSPEYITTPGPLQATVAQFWQMIWEQDCTSLVMLTSLAEDNKTVCYQYWPSEGRHTYGNFEVHLVSEHIWCEAYLVRSFYLKNIETNQTRTVTQFHFLSWAELSIPEDCKDLLDFRRKVNKSYRGKTSPIVVCCSDGSGRSGTYVLLDMVINRIHKGIKEIDIAATLEHIRDQRMNAVQTREQLEFVLSSIAEEVQALLRALPQ